MIEEYLLLSVFRYYCSGVGDATSSHTMCPAGYFCAAGSASCLICAAGSYCSEGLAAMGQVVVLLCPSSSAPELTDGLTE